jgi:hypothetical protein
MIDSLRRAARLYYRWKGLRAKSPQRRPNRDQKVSKE